MRITPSKLLESLVNLAAFDAERGGHKTHLLDRLFIMMLAQKDCHAVRILRGSLKGWELYQIRIRIEREVERAAAKAPVQNRDDFYADLLHSLGETAEMWQDPLDNPGTIPGLMPPLHGEGDNAEVRPDTGYLLLHILATADCIAGRVLGMYGVMADDVRRAMESMSDRESSETRGSGDDPDPAVEPSAGGARRGVKKGESMIAKYGVDVTRAAAEGEIDPVIGRDDEIERMVQILGRRKKNNPMLVGEAGVGKSAIVEGLALRIASGDVPPLLAGRKIVSLDVAAMIAGTKFRGEFEERIKAMVDELLARRDTIAFIDEVHTIVGAGSTQGSLDVANILKPALARGDVQCIGATTLDEYRENIEKDAALERRFQKIVVKPASWEQTLEILRHIAPGYEKFHSVRYTDEALRACVSLTERYIVDRHFPDKAIDAMDEAGSANGGLNCATGANGETQPTEITAAHIEAVITTMTGIPVERVSKGDRQRLCSLEKHLSETVVGQAAAVSRVSRSILRSRSGLRDPNKPIGVFLFVGPTGVGKTLLAKELSRWMFDRPDALVRIDMSEYAEKHNVSRLIGSPPGYVGYGEGGQLTEAVRRQPYSVVLLDEIEKAHPDIFNVMLQMLDDGHLTDGLGRRVDFRNTVIIMTSNVGSRVLSSKNQSVGYATSSTPEREAANREAEYRGALEQTFAPEFINRIDDIAMFSSLEAQDIARVVELELGVLVGRAAGLGYTVSVSESARGELAARGFEPEYGVRSLKRAITEHIEEPLAQMIVSGEIAPGAAVDVDWSSSHAEDAEGAEGVGADGAGGVDGAGAEKARKGGAGFKLHVRETAA
ncbi:MAG: ATP-dependent Clp protease ATP-binding subunit [Alistipes sp.]|jgi:ATP-dependent Clp protease ATP-binding subunit ClpC|nr:ATP-dependent Clp protease ATP-binding subunit [Alistipes sp.]